jgi:hypothetical protein
LFDSKEDSRSIGAKLGVARLLEGSVRKSGDMIRVNAELIDTADGSMQWSEQYDRSYKDLFALQDEITHAVAAALRAKLLPGGQTVCSPVCRSVISEVYALRNDAQRTFEWLDRAGSNRDSDIVYLRYDPFILRYKGDPRFAAFCRKVGLPVPRGG